LGKLRGTIAGAVGKADMSYTNTGKPNIKFSLPADQFKGGQKSTEWVRCTLWGERAEKLAEYIVKGKIVQVSGEISVSTWTGNDGTFHANLELNVFEIDLLGETRNLAVSKANNAGKSDPADWDISSL
jgi:single-strand DNA-binding protein